MTIPLAHPPNHAATLRAVPRYRRILALYLANVPVVEIARLEHVSRQRADQLIEKAQAAKRRGYF